MSEILAPAGSINSFLTAIDSGADAVYLGLDDFSARKSAENFNLENLHYYISYAKLFNVKVYVAFNTLIKNNELKKLAFYVNKAYDFGADAIILQDIFLGREIKKINKDITLHLSTQAGCSSIYTATIAKEFGFSRVILSRETTLEEIEKISKIIETECFVQGALCSSFSGSCYFSSFVGGNSGNRGQCKQPCRKKYTIYNNKNLLRKNLAYNISLSDLNIGSKIKKLKDAGVFSFKIEGRMRKPEYVASSVKYYKNILNDNEKLVDLSNLKRAFNRGNYTSGYYFGQDKNLISYKFNGHIGELVGNVTKVQNGKVSAKLNYNVSVNDAFKIIRQNIEVGSAVYLNNLPTNNNAIILNSNGDIKPGDSIYLTGDASLSLSVGANNKKIDVHISVWLVAGQKAKVVAKTLEGEYVVFGDVCQGAISSSVSAGQIKEVFEKTSNYPFNVLFDSIETDGVFYNKSKLNQLRRELFGNIFYSKNQKKQSELFDFSIIHNIMPDITSNVKENNAIICTEVPNITNVILIHLPNDFGNKEEADLFIKKSKENNCQAYLYLPPYLTSTDLDNTLFNLYDGLYCQGLYGVYLAKNMDKKIILGTSCNIFNSVDTSYLTNQGINFVLSKELSGKQIGEIANSLSYTLQIGQIEIMHLLYCPFANECASCDKSFIYNLVDEGRRNFKIRRYILNGQCRFIVYNCVDLVNVNYLSAGLYNFTLYDNNLVNALYKNKSNAQELKKILKYFTCGFANKEVL